jgi:hypothetical protein
MPTLRDILLVLMGTAGLMLAAGLQVRRSRLKRRTRARLYALVRS